jgi:hypothetical protein
MQEPPRKQSRLGAAIARLRGRLRTGHADAAQPGLRGKDEVADQLYARTRAQADSAAGRKMAGSKRTGDARTADSLEYRSKQVGKQLGRLKANPRAVFGGATDRLQAEVQRDRDRAKQLRKGSK